SGLLTSAEKLNTVGNNLANFSTAGYKEDIPFEQTIRFLVEGPYPGKDQPVLGGNALNMQNGLIQFTKRKLDMAFEGPGFFTVQGPGNQELYTRNGAFNLNSKRELVTSDGFNIMDKFDRKITVFGQKMQITPTGDIFIDDNYYTSLKVVDLPERNDLEKVGNSFLKMKDPNKQPGLLESPQLLTGALEKSNVNLLAGIGAIIRIQRTFEMQKAASDVILKSLRKTITDIAKPI
ncbi:MAG: flagellar hook basal-body protein, partial [bacterium]|nr:flagellar hook basal-body protein [bacterium]